VACLLFNREVRIATHLQVTYAQFEHHSVTLGPSAWAAGPVAYTGPAVYKGVPMVGTYTDLGAGFKKL
jgi:hypothetical protein